MGKLWKVGDADHSIRPERWTKLREMAAVQERTEIAVEDVISALKFFCARIGPGVDRTNPRWMVDLPEGGRHDLLLMLELVDGNTSGMALGHDAEHGGPAPQKIGKR
mgnify:CR=1 FL=1